MAIYLDHNATTPLDARVLDAMLPYLREAYGNPSSAHRLGRLSRAAIDQAREQVGALVGVAPGQVIFTSGGTEANTMALHAPLLSRPAGRVAVSAVEHGSVLEAAAGLGRFGWMTDSLPVDALGRITASGLRDAITPATRLVSVMLANNETGVVQQLPPLAEACREAGVLLHSDAVQAAGKLKVDFHALGVHLLSVSGHKINGPKGIGALIVDRALELTPLIPGGGQEKGLRGGTENLSAIVGFGIAAELAAQDLTEHAARLLVLRERLETGLRAAVPEAVVFAQQAERLPNTVFLALPGIDGATLVMNLDRRGFAVSSGAACGSGRDEPSHVLRAMGTSPDEALGAIRISLGRDNTEADVDALVAELAMQGQAVRSMASAWT